MYTDGSRKLMAYLTGSQRVVSSVTPPGTRDCDDEVQEAVILSRPASGFKPGSARENNRLGGTPDRVPSACSHAQSGPGLCWCVRVRDLLKYRAGGE